MDTATQQSDWNQSSTSSPAYIKNKPTIPSATPDATHSTAGKVKTGVKSDLDAGTDTQYRAWSAKDLKDFSQASGGGDSLATTIGGNSWRNPRGGTYGTLGNTLDYRQTSSNSNWVLKLTHNGSSDTATPTGATCINGTGKEEDWGAMVVSEAGDYEFKCAGVSASKLLKFGSGTVAQSLTSTVSSVNYSTTVTLAVGIYVLTGKANSAGYVQLRKL
jgi:hypothetical protein